MSIVSLPIRLHYRSWGLMRENVFLEFSIHMSQFTWMEIASECLCSSDSDSVLFPNIIHFEPDINNHKYDTNLIVLFAVSKFLG